MLYCLDITSLSLSDNLGFIFYFSLEIIGSISSYHAHSLSFSSFREYYIDWDIAASIY